jgi:hypothetical protein
MKCSWLLYADNLAAFDEAHQHTCETGNKEMSVLQELACTHVYVNKLNII